MSTHKLITDGSAAPKNPGQMTLGYVILTEDDRVVNWGSSRPGWGSSSEAEYLALIAGLSKAYDMHVLDLDIFIDSQFIYNQIIGSYKVRAAHLKKYLNQTKELISRFNNVKITWHPRTTDYARIADALTKGYKISDNGIHTTKLLEDIGRWERARHRNRGPQRKYQSRQAAARH